MATSGQSKTSTKDSTYFLVTWSLSSQDIASNTSTISYAVKVYCGHNYYSNAIKIGAIKINGTQVYGGATKSNWKKGTHTFKSGTLTIPHNSDGTKTFSIGSYTAWAYDAGNYSKSAVSFTLPTIPRKATTTSVPSNFAPNSSPSFTFNNPAGFQIQPYFNIYENSTVVKAITRPLGSYSSPYTFTLTSEEIQSINSICTKQGTYEVWMGCSTYNGGTNLGYSSLQTNLVFPVTPPTWLGYLRVRDSNSAISAITGDDTKLVYGASMPVETFFPATAQNYATIDHYEATWQGVTKRYEPEDLPRTASDFDLTVSGNTTCTLTAYDSRGFSSSISVDVYVYPWRNSQVDGNAERVNNYENETIITPKISIASIKVNNVEKNAVTLQWRYRERGTETWSIWQTRASITSWSADFNNQKEYDIELRTQDRIEATLGTFSTVKTLSIFKGVFAMFIDTLHNNVGINCFPSLDNKLQVEGGYIDAVDGLKIAHDPVVDYPIRYETVGNWTYRMWASGDYEIWYWKTSSPIAITTSTSNGWYRSAEQTFSTDEIPTPTSIRECNVDVKIGGVAYVFANVSRITLGANSFTVSFYANHLGSLNVNSTLSLKMVGRWYEDTRQVVDVYDE